MAATQESRALAATIIILIAATAGGLGYYQFFILARGSGPSVPPEYLSPPQTVTVRLVQGSFLPNNSDGDGDGRPDNFVPLRVVVVLGVNNSITWINEDEASHTVTSDDDYTDPVTRAPFGSDLFSRGQSFSFTFTQPGEYKYHCIPHAPWMKDAIVTVRAPAASSTQFIPLNLVSLSPAVLQALWALEVLLAW